VTLGSGCPVTLNSRLALSLSLQGVTGNENFGSIDGIDRIIFVVGAEVEKSVVRACCWIGDDDQKKIFFDIVLMI
jgi:hypothetical protein